MCFKCWFLLEDSLERGGSKETGVKVQIIKEKVENNIEFAVKGENW